MTIQSAQSRSFYMYLVIALAIIIADQISKYWVIQNIEYHHYIPITSFFSIAHAHNYGAAFGFLNNAGGWQTVFFSVIAVTVSIVLVIWLRRIARTERQLALALALVLGGAVGNLIDRLRFDYVVDFLLFFYDKWQFPAFNVADSAITIGAILMLMDSVGWKFIADRPEEPVES